MLRSLSRSSGTPSPPSSPQRKKHRLSMAGVADLFVKIRRWEDRAISTDELELTSGDPKTHPNVAEGAKEYDKILVEQTDYFICVGGVNLPTLLRITRIALMEHVKRELGANSVIDEQCVFFHIVFPLLLLSIVFFIMLRWECVTKPVHSGKYRVQVWLNHCYANTSELNEILYKDPLHRLCHYVICARLSSTCRTRSS